MTTNVTDICNEEMLSVASAPSVTPAITPIWTGDNVNFGTWDGQAVRMTPITAPVSIINLADIAIALTSDTNNGTGATIAIFAQLSDNTQVTLADDEDYENAGNYTFNYNGAFSGGIEYIQASVNAPGSTAYVPYFGPSYWTASNPVWDGEKYAGVTGGITLAATGGWEAGLRPTSCRVTLFVHASAQELSIYVNTESGGEPFDNINNPPLGENVIVIPMTITGNISQLTFFSNFNWPDYDITNIEFLIDDAPAIQDTTVISLTLTYNVPDPIPRSSNMEQTVPVSHIVEMLPNVITLGGDSLGANAVFLTRDTSIPINTVQSFISAEAVGDWFGYESDEYRMALRYFAGFDTASIRPSVLYFAQYNGEAVAAYTRGNTITLAQLTALTTGTLTVTVDGVVLNSGTIDLTSVTTFDGALTVINTAFDGDLTATYDTQLGAFVFTSPTTGADSTISYVTGTLAAGLKMSQGAGAVTSQGQDVLTGAEFMDGLVLITQNFLTFTTVEELVASPEGTDRCSQLIRWAASKERYLYVGWATTTVDAIAFKEYANLIGAGFCMSHYGTNSDVAAAFCGMVASINFNAVNGTIVFANKYQSGLEPSVFDGTTFEELKAARVNFYARIGLDNSQENAYIDGSMASGDWRWADSVVNQIFFMSQLQKAQFYLLRQVNKVPFNAYGQTLTSGTNRDPINQALLNRTIQPGITLSEAQKVEISSIVGAQNGAAAIAQLENIGWYEKIDYTSIPARAARTLPVTIFYTDGGGVHTLTMPVYNVQ